jgi:uncharacterized membrane protein YqaE (UPF0057 family)
MLTVTYNCNLRPACSGTPAGSKDNGIDGTRFLFLVKENRHVHILCGLLIACNAPICQIPQYICLPKMDNMKKITTQFLMLVLMVSATAAPSMAASLPAAEPATTTTKTEPAPEKVQSALDEFKNLSRHERKERIKDAKKLLKEYKAEKRAGHKEDTDLVLLAILAILLPPLAVYLKEGEVNSRFWISLILTLLFWIPGVIFALLVVFDAI